MAASIERLVKLNQINFEKLKTNLKNSKMPTMLKLAAKIALPTDLLEIERKQFFLGSVGERKDGAIVTSRNGAPYCTSTEHYQKQARSHSEARLTNKLGYGGIVYVSRISRSEFDFAMARPCLSCETFLKSYKVKKVYYSIDSDHYACWDLKTDREKIFRI